MKRPLVAWKGEDKDYTPPQTIMVSIDFTALWVEPRGKGLGCAVVPFERYCHLIKYSYRDDTDALTSVLEYLPTLLQSKWSCAGALLRDLGLPQLLVDILDSTEYPFSLKVHACIAMIHLVENHDRCASNFVGLECTDGVLEEAFVRLGCDNDGVEAATAFLDFIEKRGEEVHEEEDDSV